MGPLRVELRQGTQEPGSIGDAYAINILNDTSRSITDDSRVMLQYVVPLLQM
jgi:hypothetical protein